MTSYHSTHHFRPVPHYWMNGMVGLLMLVVSAGMIGIILMAPSPGLSHGKSADSHPLVPAMPPVLRPFCGDNVCQSNEATGWCAQDCFCGNNTCDTGENGGTCAADCAPEPALVYHRFNPSTNLQNVVLARCTRPNCVDGFTYTPIEAGHHASVGMAPSHFPILAYSKGAGNDTLTLAMCADYFCNSSTKIDVPVPGLRDNKSLVVSPNGLVTVAYSSQNDGHIHILSCSDTSCSTRAEQVLTGTNPRINTGISVALDSYGVPRIAYFDDILNVAMVVCSDPACTVSAVRTVGVFTATFANLSLVVPSDDVPVVAYSETFTGPLHVFRCGDSTCTTLGTDSYIGFSGGFPSMGISPDGTLKIAYYEGMTNRDLELVRCASPDCMQYSIVTLESSGDAGLYASMSMNAYGNPVVAHYNRSTRRIMVDACNDPNCNSVSPGRVINVLTLSTVPILQMNP